MTMLLEVLMTCKVTTRHTKSIYVIDNKVEVPAQNRKHLRGRRNILFQDLVVCDTYIAVASVCVDAYKIHVTETAS